MSDDERAIRDLVSTWMSAIQDEDTDTILSLIADDALFMVPGSEPFDKNAFAAAMQGDSILEIDAKSDIQELKIFGDWAYMRNHLTIDTIPRRAEGFRRSGYTLTILRKLESGGWVLVRDANLMI